MAKLLLPLPQMSRLHGEALAHAKRERRRANEKKQRTIQRLQLNMTAPEDIVMEDDLALKGEDVFDLGEGEAEARRRGKRAVPLDQLVRDADGLDETDEEEEDAHDADDDEILSSDEEREQKTKYLEGELDGLYDAYRERMSERDAKWKVKQARLKDKNRAAWHGIREGSDAESDNGMESIAALGRGQQEDEDSDEESEAGGWDIVANTKAKIGEEPDSSDESAESDDEAEDGQPKAKRVRLALPNGNAKPVAKVIARSQPLVMNIGADVDQAEMSRAAQVWFDQPMFKGLGDLAALDEEDDADTDAEDEDDASDEQDVKMAEDEEEVRATYFAMSLA